MPQFTTAPPQTSFTILAFPSPHILLVTLNRPKALNCISAPGHVELDAIWTWLDNEPSLRIGIITGVGRAFCAGADLKEWNTNNQASSTGARPSMRASGFGALSTRTGKKPIIAAVNGICFGGGFEMAVNVDLILASPSATFALPEVKVGVVALAGALPRLVRTVGKQRAMEMALTGRTFSAQEMRDWGVVNKVVEEGTEGGVVGEAVRWAEGIVSQGSPDSVLVSRAGINVGWDGSGVKEGTEKTARLWAEMEGGENMREGVRAFVERRKARWVDSKL